jgi:hypothetical protein
MHHTAIQLRQMMPQSDFRHALGLFFTDMEAAAKSGENSITFEDGAHGVSDMQRWVDGNDSGRAARICEELKRLGYDVRYKHVRPHTEPTLTMIVSW